MVEVAVATLARVGVDDAEVIVVNDGSSDRSAAILDDLSSREPLLRVVTHEHNRGYGGALLSGFGRRRSNGSSTPTVTASSIPPSSSCWCSARPTTSTWCRATSCAGPTA